MLFLIYRIETLKKMNAEVMMGTIWVQESVVERE
jgi:hypothetical protein